MNFMCRMFFILVSAAGCTFPAGPAWADVSGFEQLPEITLDCAKTSAEPVKPHALGRYFICTYEHRLCKVFSKNKLEFEAYISIDCEVSKVSDPCPAIEICAKPTLKPEVAEAVHQKNDPNFTGSVDGAVGDAGAEKAKGIR